MRRADKDMAEKAVIRQKWIKGSKLKDEWSTLFTLSNSS